MDVTKLCDEIVYVSDDDDISDHVTSTEDLPPVHSKAKTIKSVNLVVNAIGQINYNVIIDAICTLNNIEIKSKALAALFSCNKVVQSTQCQTETSLYEAENSEESNEDIAHNIAATESTQMHYVPENHAKDYQGMSVVTGEGELWSVR